jgi:hypothetical protein
VERLVAAGVDLIRTRFTHAAWIAAAHRLGFVPVSAATRFFASSPLAAALPPLTLVHLTHGDNDGPLPYQSDQYD